MKFLKRSTRSSPRLSIVLLDWSVRESFHLLHYLRRQNVSRDLFEVVVVEYYSRQSSAVQRFQQDVDTWVVLEMPESCYYHKHLMYNTGIVFSRGEIAVFCDSDAMVKPTFVGSILAAFEADPNIVLQLDQFRNLRRDFYPFNYPTFEQVIGEGCINNTGGKTKGLLDTSDPLHERNYGACMCAWRRDLIGIGGADEHSDYLGHICGPYDMTFRLVNFGRREVWSQDEFMYHTWHPGQAGVDNYLGPHDGRHMSTTALEALITRRIVPYVENAAIRMLRTGAAFESASLEQSLIASVYRHAWILSEKGTPFAKFVSPAHTVAIYKGFRIENELGLYTAHLLVDESAASRDRRSYTIFLESDSLEGLKRKINAETSGLIRLVTLFGGLYVLAWRVAAALHKLATNLVVKVAALPRQVVNFMVATAHRTGDRFRRFFIERNILSGSLTSLLVNLYRIGRRTHSDSPGEGDIVVLVDTKAFLYYIHFLVAVRLLPPVQIVKPESDQQLRNWVAAATQKGWSGRVIVGRDFYLRHHAALAASDLTRRIAIV